MESLLYFVGQQPGAGVLDGGGRRLSKGWLPTDGQSVGKSFIDRGRGLHAETVQSALTIILKLAIGGLISVMLIVLGTVSLQFQGCIVSISLRLILRIVAAYVMATVWSSWS